MQQIMVALDLETTGLSAHDDMIIEIGAVRFRGAEILDSYQQYVNPQRPIPPRVIDITGITPDKVAKAPLLAQVLPAFKEFCADHPIVGHNIGFDVEFLRVHGLPLPGLVIDTYEMGSVLLPTAPRYNLNAIMQRLGLSVDGDFHSALTDSKAAMLAYNALYDLLRSTPRPILENIVEAARGLNWLGFAPFADALNAEPLPTTPPLIAPKPPLAARPITADGADVRAMVEGAFRFRTPLLLEVPTGVAGGVGMLAAASAFSAETNEPVIVATYNQYSDDEQRRLLEQDLPQAAALIGSTPVAATLKAPQFYLCPRRLETLRRRPPTSIEELRVLAKILIWGDRALTDDRDSISLRGPAEYQAWYRLSAADEHCTLERCETQTGGACPFYKACKAAQDANLIFIDHGLLFADQRS